MTNKTKQAILIIILCVLVFMLILTINAMHASAASLDTAYCSACDSTGITASGKPLAWGRVASNDYPIGTRLYIDGYGECVVEDRMRDNGKVDVYLGDRDVCSCGSEWGRRQIAVEVMG